MSEAGSRPGGKGRPTPKRSESSTVRRRSVRPPKDRKEAVAQARLADKAERQRKRVAYQSGDPGAMPARDAGPMRGFVRDFVDSRRTVGEFLMPALLVSFVVSLLPAVRFTSVLFLYILLVVAAIDSFLMTRSLKRELAKRFPDESTQGLGFYAVTRGLQFRKLRTPKPRVRPGAAL